LSGDSLITGLNGNYGILANWLGKSGSSSDSDSSDYGKRRVFLDNSRLNIRTRRLILTDSAPSNASIGKSKSKGRDSMWSKHRGRYSWLRLVVSG
ncbi:hypothetical protein U1Q18_027709, partial [Sarracenia purpurea var. burkii]